MDDYLFEYHVKSCKQVEEKTSYIEIFNYSDSSENSYEEHPLTLDEFENFLSRRGAFSPPKLAEGVKLVNGMRLIVQKNVEHRDTFAPEVISLPHDLYISMAKKMRLPLKAIEGSALVGPFFWCAYDQDEEDPHLQIIFRKSDVRKKGKTRGWEIMLSYSFRDGITTGFVKGTESSDIVKSLAHLTDCRSDVGHPLLLPMIILTHDLSAKGDIRQRGNREWLRSLENAITMRDEIDEHEAYTIFDVDTINRDLVECNSQVLWKRPQAYQVIVSEFKAALTKYRDRVRDERDSEKMKALNASMEGRLEFYRIKLTGMEHYIHTTLERLHIQRQALYNIMTQRESKLNLEMAAQQRRLAHASKRDSTAMKTLSLLGAVFLPGTFLSSIFSMTFFNFDVGDGKEVSSDLWIYFAVTIPLTLAIVLSWWALDHYREKQYAAEDQDIEKGIEKMETDILAIMRKKTMNKASTWNSGSRSPGLPKGSTVFFAPGSLPMEKKHM
ncbi:hypothetical protein F4810DRAFT_299966 [Camillea tinctor]|nr:hypothetical protein F4810DRAFT_299966 [Camillea tinctor]